jgi:hypothetical protein
VHYSCVLLLLVCMAEPSLRLCRINRLAYCAWGETLMIRQVSDGSCGNVATRDLNNGTVSTTHSVSAGMHGHLVPTSCEGHLLSRLIKHYVQRWRQPLDKLPSIALSFFSDCPKHEIGHVPIRRFRNRNRNKLLL